MLKITKFKKPDNPALLVMNLAFILYGAINISKDPLNPINIIAAICIGINSYFAYKAWVG